MARFRKRRASPRRARARPSFRGFKRRSSRRSSGGGLKSNLLAAAIYGGVRAPVATMASGLSSKLPFGKYNDEAAMIGGSYAAMKYGSGLVKNVGTIGLYIEVASVISQMTSGVTSGAQSNNNLFVGGY